MFLAYQKTNQYPLSSENLLKEDFVKSLKAIGVADHLSNDLIKNDFWKNINWDKKTELQSYENGKISSIIYYINADDKEFNYKSVLL